MSSSGSSSRVHRSRRGGGGGRGRGRGEGGGRGRGGGEGGHRRRYERRFLFGDEHEREFGYGDEDEDEDEREDEPQESSFNFEPDEIVNFDVLVFYLGDPRPIGGFMRAGIQDLADLREAVDRIIHPNEREYFMTFLTAEGEELNLPDPAGWPTFIGRLRKVVVRFGFLQCGARPMLANVLADGLLV